MLGQIFEITHPFIIAGWFRLSIGHKGIKIEHVFLMKLIPVLGTYQDWYRLLYAIVPLIYRNPFTIM
jgi:hypothetical protein